MADKRIEARAYTREHGEDALRSTTGSGRTDHSAP